MFVSSKKRYQPIQYIFFSMELQSPSESEKNRSNDTDRRQEEGAPGLRYLFFGRRKTIRRRTDHQESYFLDHFSVRVFSIIIVIILLSVTDAMLTLHLISKGAAEINPIMEHFLQYGTLPFLTAKYLLTTASVTLLLIYKNVHIFGTKIRAKYLFILILLIFISVVLWELYLIWFQ
ncbi:DUF5658 family protein [Candidatus Scalindua japonica]|uniref:DUF5658 family protein n=1 Tax=Candidatus Scalindua japonica TaxID=1284222 RepID=UPI0026A5F24B